MNIITGQFLRKIYGSPNGEYHVYKFMPKDRIACTAVLRGKHTPDLAGEYVLTGHWKVNKTYGPQFVIDHLDRYKTSLEKGNDAIKHIRGMLVA